MIYSPCHPPSNVDDLEDDAKGVDKESNREVADANVQVAQVNKRDTGQMDNAERDASGISNQDANAAVNSAPSDVFIETHTLHGARASVITAHIRESHAHDRVQAAFTASLADLESLPDELPIDVDQVLLEEEGEDTTDGSTDDSFAEMGADEEGADTSTIIRGTSNDRMLRLEALVESQDQRLRELEAKLGLTATSGNDDHDDEELEAEQDKVMMGDDKPAKDLISLASIGERRVGSGIKRRGRAAVGFPGEGWVKGKIRGVFGCCNMFLFVYCLSCRLSYTLSPDILSPDIKSPPESPPVLSSSSSSSSASASSASSTSHPSLLPPSPSSSDQHDQEQNLQAGLELYQGQYREADHQHLQTDHRLGQGDLGEDQARRQERRWPVGDD